MIEKELMEEIDNLIKRKLWGLPSRSAVIRFIIKDYIERVKKGDISVEKT